MVNPSPSRLNPKRISRYKQERLKKPEDKANFVKRCYESGGKDFLMSVEKWGVNERNEKILLSNWTREYCEFIGDMRIAETLTHGASQIGKTVFHTLLLCYCLTEGGLNTLWSYDQERSLNIQVPSNFRPVVKAWLKSRGIRTRVSEGTQNNTLYQVKGATAQFVYVSTSKIKDAGGAAAGGIAVGVSRDILFKEERSQYPPGSDAPLDRRLDAGKLPSRPIRQLGTSGSGLGIELEVESADYDFHPHTKCPNCGAEFNLTPKGCLLQSCGIKGGKPIYLSESGRPVKWYHRNPKEAITSAYFACPHCESEIPKQSRTTKVWFRCIKTGINLRTFLDTLPKGYPERRIKAAICLSPLLRETEYNLATEIIREGLETFNPPDWCQQRLGIASDSGANNVDIEMLRQAIASLIPQGKPDFILAGVDQGRGEDWLWVCAYYLPRDRGDMSINEIMEGSDRLVLFGGDVVRSAIPDKLEEYGVDYGIIDNEPDRSDASELCRITPLEMADQKPGQKDVVKKSTVDDGGIEYPCWNLRAERFLKAVLLGFTMNRYSLPNEWDKWLGMMGNERSPITHLMGPSYDPASGKWKRGKNNVDDLYYAAMFCEAAFYLYLENHLTDNTFDVGEERGVYGAISGY